MVSLGGLHGFFYCVRPAVTLNLHLSFSWADGSYRVAANAAPYRLPGTTVYRNVQRFPMAEEVEGVRVMRFDGNLNFANWVSRCCVVDKCSVSCTSGERKR